MIKEKLWRLRPDAEHYRCIESIGRIYLFWDEQAIAERMAVSGVKISSDFGQRVQYMAGTKRLPVPDFFDHETGNMTVWPHLTDKMASVFDEATVIWTVDLDGKTLHRHFPVVWETGIDLSKCIFDDNLGTGYLSNWRKIGAKDDFAPSHHIFRFREHDTLGTQVIVTDTFKLAYEQHRFTGLGFVEVER